MPLHAGLEASGIACRTFRATLAALALLTGTVEVAKLRPLVSALRARFATSRQRRIRSEGQGTLILASRHA